MEMLVLRSFELDSGGAAHAAPQAPLAASAEQSANADPAAALGRCQTAIPRVATLQYPNKAHTTRRRGVAFVHCVCHHPFSHHEDVGVRPELPRQCAGACVEAADVKVLRAKYSQAPISVSRWTQSRRLQVSVTGPRCHAPSTPQRVPTHPAPSLFHFLSPACCASPSAFGTPLTSCMAAPHRQAAQLPCSFRVPAWVEEGGVVLLRQVVHHLRVQHCRRLANALQLCLCGEQCEAGDKTKSGRGGKPGGRCPTSRCSTAAGECAPTLHLWCESRDYMKAGRSKKQGGRCNKGLQQCTWLVNALLVSVGVIGRFKRHGNNRGISRARCCPSCL